MNKNSSKIIVSILVVLVIVVTILSFYVFKPSTPEIVYVDNVQLFNGFHMSKDLGKINGDKINTQKKKLDSLYSIYSIFREQQNEEKAQELETQLRSEDQELKKMNEYFSKDLSQKVWNRLNQYIKEYSETKAYKIVLGTQGTGNIMYAQEGIDITEEVLIYVNEKYEGN